MRHQQDRGRGHLAYRLKGDGDLLSLGIEQANPGKAGQQAPARSPVAKPDPSADHTTAMEPGWGMTEPPPTWRVAAQAARTKTIESVVARRTRILP